MINSNQIIIPFITDNRIEQLLTVYTYANITELLDSVLYDLRTDADLNEVRGLLRERLTAQVGEILKSPYSIKILLLGNFLELTNNDSTFAMADARMLAKWNMKNNCIVFDDVVGTIIQQYKQGFNLVGVYGLSDVGTIIEREKYRPKDSGIKHIHLNH